MAILDRVRIVLLETTHPGNIGGVARAMKTMGLSRLYLVAPRSFPSAEATTRATGAVDVLDRAVVCDGLDTALADCALVVGATARPRKVAWSTLEPRECGHQLAAAATENDVALVCGRERSGLSNDEVERCHHLVTIPTNPDFGSLNLAAAVQVLAYEIAMAARGPVSAAHREPPAAAEDLRQFYAHLQAVLEEIEFTRAPRTRSVMRKLARLFNRAEPLANEVAMLRGILTAVETAVRRKT